MLSLSTAYSQDKWIYIRGYLQGNKQERVMYTGGEISKTIKPVDLALRQIAYYLQPSFGQILSSSIRDTCSGLEMNACVRTKELTKILELFVNNQNFAIGSLPAVRSRRVAVSFVRALKYNLGFSN